MNVDVLRRWWPLPAGFALGIIIAVLVSLIGSTTSKAEAKVLISSPAGTTAVRPQLPNLRELATSGVVAGNVRSTLRLSESTDELRRHLDAAVRPESEVIAISVTNDDAERARQVAQEAAVVFAQLVGARFGSATPELHAAVLDSAHVIGGPNRHFLRNGVIGALVGILLGAAALFVLAAGTGRAPVSADERDLKQRERLLDERVKGITGRERALAVQAGKLAAREHDLAERERAEAEAPAAPEPAPEPLPEPEPEPQPAAQPEEVRVGGSWNVNELQRAVEAQSDTSTARAEEWRTYLFFLRQHAAVDGSLPSQFDGLIQDVFGDVI